MKNTFQLKYVIESSRIAASYELRALLRRTFCCFLNLSIANELKTNEVNSVEVVPQNYAARYFVTRDSFIRDRALCFFAEKIKQAQRFFRFAVSRDASVGSSNGVRPSGTSQLQLDGSGEPLESEPQ